MPNEHVWIEKENKDKDSQGNDSVNSFGPITRKLIADEVKRVVWPPWKYDSLPKVEDRVFLEYNLKGQYKPTHS